MNEQEKVNFFGYRVGGIMIKNGKILFHSDNIYDFWVVPGGSVKPFESSEQAINREFREEIGIEVAVERLLFIIENSFEFEGELYYCLELMFLITPKQPEEKLEQEEFIGIENDYMPEKYDDEFKLTFRWFNPSEFDSIVLLPVILKDALKNIPDHPILLRNLEINKKY